MTTTRIFGLAVSVVCAAAISACGGGTVTSPAASPATTQGTGTVEGSPGGGSCRDVKVPGHQATNLKAAATGCGVAEKVAAAAEGRGRTAYDSSGFACTPSAATGGDTNYTCSMGSATITFLYGAA